MKRDGNIGGSTESSVSTNNKKSEGKGGTQQNFNSFFSNPVVQKRKNEDDTQQKRQDMIDAVLKVPKKQAKDGEDKRKFNVNEIKDTKERTAPVIQSAFVGDSSELSVCKRETLTQFKKIFNDIDESQIRN